MDDAPTTYRLVTGPNGTVHLAPRLPARRPAQLTLCGRETEGWRFGAETTAMAGVTCGSCRRVISADIRARAYSRMRAEVEP
jgi:hypothetical protein